ncbi:hypothetical protein [Pelobacter propionicus]|uniref:hypothetical protein n=1 Tax=Pelobacter propionicus TaxID=29543 RepID=UPI000318BD5F|nr:hypothetical protein [Pelobacter propionicus]
MYERLQAKAKNLVPGQYADLGTLIAVDGSLIDAVPTMEFADYRKGGNKNPYYGYGFTRAKC